MARKAKIKKMYGQVWEWIENVWESACWENTTGRNRVRIYPPSDIVPYWCVHLRYLFAEEEVSREYMLTGKNAKARAFSVARGLVNQREKVSF